MTNWPYLDDPRSALVRVTSGRDLAYPDVNLIRVDRAGNLRLYQQRRFLPVRQRVFHPKGEWVSVHLLATP